jgi:hypothetical protein
MISSAAREWKEEDPAAASAAVSRSSLSKEAKTRILKSLED